MAEKPKTPTKKKEPKAASPKPRDAAPVAPPPAAAAARAPAPAPTPAKSATPSAHEHKTHSFRRRLLGRVVSDKMNKTVVVEVIRRSRDQVYKKYVRSRDRYKAHDEKNEFKFGDRVEIMEHRPISKDKRWKVVRLVTRAALE
jgi:small subunit ribosomal protein S17